MDIYIYIWACAKEVRWSFFTFWPKAPVESISRSGAVLAQLRSGPSPFWPARSGPPCSGPVPGTVRFHKQNIFHASALRLVSKFGVMDHFRN